MRARRALLTDAETIHELIAKFTPDGTLLPRSLAEICENIRDFLVVEEQGTVVACGALHIYGIHLSEIRSITVRPSAHGHGAGRLLVEALLKEADLHSITCVCLFTRIPEFFARMGFEIAERESLPDKIYKDCVNCPRQHACDEIAMFRGELPHVSILHSSHPELVKLEP